MTQRFQIITASAAKKRNRKAIKDLDLALDYAGYPLEDNAIYFVDPTNSDPTHLFLIFDPSGESYGPTKGVDLQGNPVIFEGQPENIVWYYPSKVKGDSGGPYWDSVVTKHENLISDGHITRSEALDIISSNS